MGVVISGCGIEVAVFFFCIFILKLTLQLTLLLILNW